MLWMDTSEGSFLTNNGGVLLADNATFPGLKKVVEAQGYLCAELAPPGPAARGRLSLLIEEGIELALEKVGAVAPGVGASANVDASISDQLYRARLVEKRGIVVMLPFLEGIGNLAGTLDGEDSVTLSWWMQATQERPLGLVIESANQSLKIYPAPVPFDTLLRNTTYPPPPPTAPEQASSSEAMDLSEPPPEVVVSSHESSGCASASNDSASYDRMADDDTSDDDTSDDAISDGAAEPCEVLSAPAALELDAQHAQNLLPESPVTANARDLEPALDVHEARTVKIEPTRDILEAARNGELQVSTLVLPPPPAATSDAVELPREPDAQPHAPVATSAEAVRESGDDPSDDSGTDLSDALSAVLTDESSASTSSEKPDTNDGAPSTAVTPPPSSARLLKGARSQRPRADMVLDDADTTDPFHRMAQREWPNWLRELDSTRGPKPLAVVERTFVSAYTPLKEAWLRNIASPKALAALRTFADSFEHSYSEAFDALRVRGKRPTMVLDVPEIAQRIGRLHGARSIQLVLVDAMRFDVGLRVQDRLRKLAKGQVSLAERLLLWSALPSTTETQLDLIGKGSSGLREPITPQETPAVVARGKNAATPRRIKAGQRELIKLDVIEAALAEPGKAEPTRLDELADGVAQAMADYMSKLPPRTLVMMFGDHGFLIDPVVGGTSAGRSGGASPEEVLVPAFAWLVGNVH